MISGLVCPACRRELAQGGDTLRCPGCERVYPVVAGIPDLRIRPDHYLSLEEDREKALTLVRRGDLGFEALVRAYWEMTPEVPADLAERYTAAALAGRDRGMAVLQDWGVSLDGARLLDVGCGTGGLLEAAAEAGARPVGVDIALRWLVVARRRLEEAGMDVPLIAADGAVLPFHPGGFDLVVSVETLEHAGDRRGLLHACLWAQAEGGRCLVVTANRFSLAPEPTVALFGVGFLPSSLASRYVRWRRHTRYSYFRATSVGELRALLGPGVSPDIGPALLPPPMAPVSTTERLARRLYQSVRKSKLRRPLALVAPFLEVRT